MVAEVRSARREAGEPVHVGAPMTAAQARFWRHEQLSESSGANNSLAGMRFKGRLETAKLAVAFRSLLVRHEILRTRFEQCGDTALQVVEPAAGLHMAFVDLSGLPECATVLDRLRHELLRRRFDLRRPPLLSLVLVRLHPEAHILLFVIHHIISDGWSQRLLIEELVATYQAGGPPDDAPIAPQYSQYAIAEREQLASAEFLDEQAWWSRYLAGAAPVGLSHEVVGVPGERGLKHRFRVDAEITAALVALGSRNRASLTNVLLAGLLLTLSERAGQRDCLIGLLSGLRSSATLERALGCMTNVLCLRTRLAPCAIDALIRGVRDGYLDVLEHPRLPFEHAARMLPARVGTPVEVLYVAQPPQPPAPKLEGLTLEALEFDEHVPAFPLVVMSTPGEGGVSFSLEYDAALYGADAVAAFAENLHWTLAQLAEGAALDTSAIGRSFPDAQQRRTVAVTTSVDPGGQTVHGLFEACAAANGDSVAVVDDSGSISYRKLDRWAGRIAAALQPAVAADPETVVAVSCTRSIAMIAAWLGIMKAGAIAQPIDLAESAPEIERRLRWSRAVAVLTDIPLERPVHGSLPVMSVVAYRESGESGIPSPRVPAEHAVGYICFTSGSTGAPAAVVGSHAGTVNRLLWLQRECTIRPQERCAVRTSPAFVDAVAEIFGPLCAGATLILCSEETAFEPAALVAAIRAHRIERVTLVPTLLRSLLPVLQRNSSILPERLTWHVSGEPLPADLLRAFRSIRPRDILLNLYGSAELAADISCARLSDNNDTQLVHVGRPIDNCNLLVLDEHLNPTPPFVEGDVYAQGIALSRGYLRDPVRTAERFVPAPTSAGARMYRTGDRGYWLGDGNLRLAGRRDRQVKRHGVRINLDAVEASLAAVSSIAASAVFCDADTQRMVAMVTLHDPRPLAWIPIDAPQAGPSRIAVLGELPERQLWAEVVAALPVNLLPDHLVALDRLPRTSGGKVNYGLLAQLSCRAVNEYRDVHETAAASPTEQALIAICERVLHRSGVKSGERFLELRMSSLQLVQVMHAVAETFSIRLKLSQLYGAASLRQCAELIDTEVEAVAALLEELA